MILIDFPTWARLLLAVLGLALVFSCLCRARHMTLRGTVTAIRYSTTALAGAGWTLTIAALLRPDWMVWALTTLSVAALAVQATSARYWWRGLPEQFRR